MVSLLISAAHKSSGKTTLSIGLCAALRARKLTVQPFKKGPDYIDPLWLHAASGNACYNLDFNTMDKAEMTEVFRRYSQTADISLIEANKGLYDGISLDNSDSNAAIAKLLNVPVILVIDSRGITRGIAPLLLGYQQFDKNIRLAGVILNRVGGERHARKLRESIEYYTDLPVLGAVQNDAELSITERHLGLMPCNESDHEQAQQKIAQIKDRVTAQLDLDRILNITGYQIASMLSKSSTTLTETALSINAANDIRIGICQDQAFGFYYPDDLSALREAGAELIPINTLKDYELPDIDGLFIGGGFPETQMHELAANHPLRNRIYQAIEAGLPTYAECGGLMYLARSLHWRGEQADMVGIIPGDVVMYDKPQGRGYVRLQETAAMPWPDSKPERNEHRYKQPPLINAHEFHYSRLENLMANGRFAYHVRRGTGIDGEYDGWVYRNLLASYSHLRDTHQCRWARRFIDFVRTHKSSTKQY